jgi:hypothetical protein
MQGDLDAIQQFIAAAPLDEAAQRTLAWLLEPLPEQYAALAATFDARHAAEIRTRVQAALGLLAQSAPRKAAGVELATAVLAQFQALHERLGLAPLEIKAPKGRKAA